MGSDATRYDTGHGQGGVLEAFPGALVRVANDGAITDANDEAKRLLGLDDRGPSTRRLTDWASAAIREDGSPCPVAELPGAKVLVTGEPDGPRTLGIRRPDGSLVWVVLRAVPAHDPRGEVAGALIAFLEVGDRRRNGKELRRSGLEWRSPAENIPSFAIVIDGDARLLSLNRIPPGFSGSEMLGSSAFDYLDAASVPVFRSALEQTKATRKRTTVELHAVSPHGDRAWYEASLNPLAGGEAIERILVVAQDVSERKRAEEAIRASERRWNILAESIPDVVATLDRDARLLSLNRSLPDGSSPIGQSAYAFFTESSAAEYRATFEHVLASRTTARFESRVRGEENKLGVWYETILVPLAEAEGGEVERVLAVARDVTERKRNEEAIRASEQRWRMLVDNLPDIVLVLDRDRRILSANIPGMPGAADAAVGQVVDTFLDDTMLAEFLGHVARALETAKSVRYEIRSDAGTGLPRWYDAILVPLQTNDVIDRLMVVTRDITSQRAMLATLAEKERLASVGMVAAGVAHEIMNPLAYVLANVELALGQRHEDAASWRQALTAAHEGAKRMQQIVSDLRSLGRAGAEELLYVDARSVLETALRLSGPEVGRTATIALDLAEVPSVFASESRLCQVFINLLVNAAQSMATMPPEQREIRVQTRYDEATSLVAIEIADRGIGIPAFLHARIFEPFFTTKRPGTGLGLSISRDIVASMGGRIDLTSTLGEGTTFTVWLPATRADARRGAG